jgi:hypothetical protein
MGGWKQEGCLMTIEICKPELEALIRERMKSGTFDNVEDVLIQALKSSPLQSVKGTDPSDETPIPTGAALIKAMQASPYKEIVFEPMRERLPVRDVVF